MRRLALALALLLAGCASLGRSVDDVCVAGKITEEGARGLNATEGASYRRHDDYPYPIRANDRIVNGDCSELLKAVTQGD